MNKKFYLAGALALALSMAKPQFAFASDPTSDYEETTVSIGGNTIQAHRTIGGVDYAVWQKDVSGVKTYVAFVTKIDGTTADITIADEIDLGEIFDNKKVKVVGFDTRTAWSDQAKQNITSITIKANAITKIEANLFKDFTALQKVITTLNVTEIGASAFENCTALTSFGNKERGKCYIQANYEKIGDSAFANTGFETIFVVSTTRTSGVDFGKNPWKGCKSLKTIEVKEEALTYFADYSNMLVYKNGANNELITYALGAGAVESVEIPENVTIKPNAFDGNEGMITTLTVPSTAKTDGGALANVKAETIVLQNGFSNLNDVKYIVSGTNANVNTLKVENVTGSAKIEAASFAGLTLLENMTIKSANSTALTFDTDSKVPAGLKTLTLENIKVQNTIYDGIALNSLTLIKSDVTTACPFDDTQLPANSLDLTLEEANVGDSFKEKVSIKKVLMNCQPEGTPMTGFSFEGCTNLAEVTLAQDITVIPAKAFYGTAITSIDLSNVVTVSASAFEGTAITSVNLSKAAGLGNRAFAGTKLTSVSLDNLSYVGPSVFADCTELTEATVKNSTLKYGTPEVPSKIFTGCTNLASLNLEKVSFDATEFADLSIKTLVAKNMTEMPNDAFKNQIELTSVDLEGSNVPNSAFNGCVKLAEVSNLNAMTIGSEAFRDCKALETITLGDKVETIYNYAFAGTDLTKITLPASVNKISMGAFLVKNHLEEVNVENATSVIILDSGSLTFKEKTVKTVNDQNQVIVDGDITFVGDEDVTTKDGVTTHTVQPTTLNVPANMLASYKNATTQWKNFYSVISQNEQSISWNREGGKSGNDFTNSTETSLSKLTFTREIKSAGWLDWYEPFDVTVKDLLDQGIQVAQVYNIMANINEDGSIGNNETTLLCYILTDENRVIKANHPYMIRKVAEEDVVNLALVFTAPTNTLNPVYNYAGDIQGDLIGYTMSKQDGNKESIKLHAADANTLTASSLRSEYYFKGIYQSDKIKSDSEGGITTYAFTNSGLTKLGENGSNLYGQRWYFQIKNKDAYQNEGGYNNAPASASKINIVASYDDQNGTTGISVIENTIANHAEGIYTVDGKKVQSLENMPAGVYVVNGKAVYKK